MNDRQKILLQQMLKANPSSKGQQAMLPADEREANRQKFLADSVVKSRVYHGTMAPDIKQFRTPAFFASKKVANQFADPEYLFGTTSADAGEHPNVMPVHLKLKNPKIYTTDEEYEEHVVGLSGVPKDLVKQGYDGIIYAPDGDFSSPDAYYVAFHPHQIKSAIGNRGTYDPKDPDITKADGGKVKEPKSTVKAYKLFRVQEKHPGKLFPLFVDASTPVKIGKWVDAKEGEMKDGKVKSKIGNLAYRPGWHAGDLPIATHIGEKSSSDVTAPDIRPHNHVWAEVEMPNDVDWQSIANERGTNAQGKLVPVRAHITDQIPKGGHYRYKTNPNMTGNWLIGGSMKVNRVLGDKEVERINKKFGVSDLPRAKPFNKKAFGFAQGGSIAPQEWVAEEHVNHMAKGGSIPSQAVMRLAVGGQGPKNWLKGSVEEVLNPLKSQGPSEADRAWFEQRREQNPEEYQRGMQAIPRTEAINQWIERNLANYVKKQMATHDDPIRKLAEQGIVHKPIQQIDNGGPSQAEVIRRSWGEPQLGKSPEAKAWEDRADVVLHRMPIKELGQDYKEPWMEKADPNTKIFMPTISMHPRYLGFDHIIDVLKQDIEEGRIRPEQLSKVSIEQAVRRVHEYDQERKKVMAQTALQATKDMPVVKEYPNGYKWIELKLDERMPEGWSKLPSGVYQDPEGNKTIYHPNYQKLADALKYEGDVMGHCVGGYGSDVARGASRIFSLRDENNEPHITIETEPDELRHHIGPEKKRDLSQEEWKLAMDAIKAYKQKRPNADSTKDSFWEVGGDADLAQKEAGLVWHPDKIVQIKGKGNRKPVDKYKAYGQDFVRSGQWSDEGNQELNNVDLRDVKKTPALHKWLQNNQIEHQRFMTPEEYSAHENNFLQQTQAETKPDTKPMAKGGSVIKQLEEYLRQREGEYGVKRLQRAADEIPHLERMYTEDALRRAFGGDNAKALMTMDPSTFENYALRLHAGNEQLQHDANTIPIDYVKGLPDMTEPQYIRHLALIKSGFADVPFLEIGRRNPKYLPNIEGHEGRHRSRALAKKKVQKSLVQLMPTGAMREPMPRRYREDFIEAMKKELGEKRLVTGEGRALLPADLTAPEHKNLEKRNLLGGRPQLPEVYEDGGKVDAESYFFPSKE